MSTTEPRMVNGLEVIADEPTEAPLPSKSGGPIYWTQTRTLLLADGSTVYGCAHCDYTSSNVNSIRPHLNRHRSRTAPATGTVTAAEGDPVGELLARIGSYEKIVADRDEWRRRAQTAERRLRAIRTAIGGDS
jgi:hypothetical protein